MTSSVDSGGATGMAGNVILGGIIGAGVETGAMHSHKPNPLSVKLEPIGQEERKDEGQQLTFSCLTSHQRIVPRKLDPVL